MLGRNEREKVNDEKRIRKRGGDGRKKGESKGDELGE